MKQKNWKMNESECCFQYLSVFIYLFLRFWAFLCFLSACEDLIKAARESWCSGMRIRWRGIGCQTTIIFLYLHSFLPYLALCAYLGSGCSPISSALPWPLPLPSTLPTQVAFLPAASQQACTSSGEREWERQLDRDGGQRLQKANKILEEKVYKSALGELLSWSYWLSGTQTQPFCQVGANFKKQSEDRTAHCCTDWIAHSHKWQN